MEIMFLLTVQNNLSASIRINRRIEVYKPVAYIDIGAANLKTNSRTLMVVTRIRVVG